MPLSATPELHPQPQVIAVYESAVCFLLYDFLSYFVILMYIYSFWFSGNNDPTVNLMRDK